MSLLHESNTYCVQCTSRICQIVRLAPLFPQGLQKERKSWEEKKKEEKDFIHV